VRTRQGDPDGPKDANDALRAGKDLNAILKKAGRTPHQQVISFQDMADEVCPRGCPSWLIRRTWWPLVVTH
jgi:hypothetical protein